MAAIDRRAIALLALSLLAQSSPSARSAPAFPPAYKPTLSAPMQRFEQRPVFQDIKRVRTTTRGVILGLMPPSTLIVTSMNPQVTKRKYVGMVSLVDFAASDDGMILWAVGKDASILRSDNGGDTWKRLPSPEDAAWGSVETTPDGKVSWIARPNGSVYRSAADGTSWERITLDKAMHIEGLAYVPATRKLVVSGSIGEFGSFMTGDAFGGQMAPRDCGHKGRYFRAIGASSDGQHLLVAGDEGFGCRSDDAGKTWRLVRPSAKGYFIDSAEFDREADDFLVTGAGGLLNAPTRRGQWVSNGPDWLSETVYSTARAKSGPFLVAGGEAGLLMARAKRSEPWKQIGDNSLEYSDFTSVSASDDDQHVLVTSDGGDVLTSDDSAASFHRDVVSDVTLTASAVSPDGRTEWVADSAGAVFRRDLQQRKWEQVESLEDPVARLLPLSDGSILIAAKSTGIWLRGRGTTRRQVYRPPHDTLVNWIASAPDDQLLLASTNKGTVLVSKNGGQAWTSVVVASSEYDFASAFIAPDRSMWVGSRGGTLYRSLDEGKTWSVVPLQGAGRIGGIAQFGGALWYSTGSKLNVSRDWGLSTSQEFTGADDGIFLASTHGSLWFAGSYHQLGRMTAASVSFPKLAAFSRIEKIRPGANVLDVTMARGGDACAQNIKFSSRVLYSTGEGSTITPVRAEWTAAEKAALHFDVPTAVNDGPLTLVLYTTNNDPECPSYYYGYTFPNLALKSWIDSVPGGWTTLSVISAAICLPLISLLLYWLSPLKLLRLRQFLSGGVGDGKLKLVTNILNTWLIAGILCRKDRVLNAWVAAVAPLHVKTLKAAASNQSEAKYLPLPVSIAFFDSAPTRIDEPNAEVLAAALHGVSLVKSLQIVGVGGAGKSTLAWKIAEWAAQVPVLGKQALIIPVERSSVPLAETLKSWLEHVEGKASVSTELVDDLLSTGRIVPFMDRLSERDADTRRRMFELCSLAPLVLVTSRNQEPDCGRSIRFEPSYLASASSLSRFIEFEVAQHIALDGLSEILTPVNIAAELLRLLERGRTGRKITPLLASTFVAIACDILRQEDEIDRLPRSVVRIYIEFIRSLHARGRVCFDGVGEREYMLMSSRLAAQCMLNGAGPASLARDAVSDIIAKSIPQHDSASVLNCLISIGLLHQFNRAGSLRVAFSIDSYAEVLAAWHIARGDEVRLAPVLQELKLPADMQGSAQEVLSYLEELRAEPSPQREAIVL